MEQRDLSNDLAIIALGGRFPGAGDVAQLWRNVLEGKSAAEPISDEEILEAGVDERDLNHPAYVKVGNFLEGEDRFDAGFFDMNPREAERIDPQQRLFLECAWETLETAGYDPARTPGRIGVVASVSATEYFERVARAADDPILGFEARISNDKDFIATRVGYKFDLRGPCLTVQTACSSSLVAVHVACQALLNGEADLMLAGGGSVRIPQRTGYLYQEGFILSPDGECRAFDASAQGCNGGNGVGVVLLKRLEDALEDGDQVWAVIRASAINNDGRDKVGFTAPGIDGQSEVIAEALSVADLDPSTIHYIEAHGTGTELGDPIEVAALTRVYRNHTDAVGYCALGSIKTNIGHLDAAAGVVGLIKAALVVHEGVIPPSPYFRAPNSELQLETSPFVVHRETASMPRANHPRRAAVSAFGIGGTNAHVLLEQTPAAEPCQPTKKDHTLLLLSARREKALEEATDRLADALERDPDLPLADVAYTLQVGRQRFEHRRSVVGQSREELIAALRQRDPKRTASLREEASGTPVSFLFPGGGAQYLHMGRDLYRGEPEFRRALDACCDFLARETDNDPRALLFPPAGETPPTAAEIERTSRALPALFATEYALAKLFASFGIEPRAVIGHSLGEYTAACLAGVFSLEDALRLVVQRGELFERLPEGAMLSVPLSEEELTARLTPELSIAAVNGPAMSVASGTVAAIEQLALKLEGEGIEARRLHIAVAAHSHLVDSILEEFAAFVRTIDLSPPRIPLLSNVDGTWATAEGVTDPDYWVRHLRRTVRFGQGLATLLEDPDQVLLEVGPGRTLSHFATQAPQRGAGTRVLTTMRHPKDQSSDVAFFHDTLGKLWLYGVDLEWVALYPGERRRRVALPTYPFQHQSLLLRPQPRDTTTLRRRPADDNLWLPVWRRSGALSPPATEEEHGFLILPGYDGPGYGGAGEGLGERLEAALDGAGEKVAVASPEMVRRLVPEALESLLRKPDLSTMPLTVVSCLSWGEPASEDEFWRRELVPLRRWVPALNAIGHRRPVRLFVVTSGGASVVGEELDPRRAALAALLDPLRMEAPHLATAFVDLTPGAADPDGAPVATEFQALLREVRGEPRGVVALRRTQRWQPGFEPLVAPPAPTPMPSGSPASGACLLLGFGRLGQQLAPELLRLPGTEGTPLVVVTRQPLPADSPGTARLAELRRQGAAVEAVHGNVEDAAFVRDLVQRVIRDHGGVVGVLDAIGPGDLDDAGEPLPSTTFEEADPGDLAAALAATDRRLTVLDLVLMEALTEAPEQVAPAFCFFTSCLVSLAGGLGATAAALHHRYLEARIAGRNQRARRPWTVITWDAWDFAAEAREGTPVAEDALTPEEGRRALRSLLAREPGEAALVSHREVERWLEERRREGADEAAAAYFDEEDESHQRPQLTTPYVAPTHDLEERVVALFQELLGIRKVGIHDNFFELGGSSLLAAKAISQVREEFSAAPPLARLFEEPTPAGLAGLIAAAQMISTPPSPEPSEVVEETQDVDRETGEI